MKRKIILVENVYRNLSTYNSRAFTDTKKAEAYFTKLVKAMGVTDQEEIESTLDDGFYDDPTQNISVIIKEIPFDDGDTFD